MPPDAIAAMQRPAALLIGHPGHELRVFGWLRAMRPRVTILTDGSGTDAVSRLDRTTNLLTKSGASPGKVYGEFTDRGIYQAMMDRQTARFSELVEEIAAEWIEEGVEVIASDADEGYCPTHDLCCEMAAAAVELVLCRTGRIIERYTFCLTEFHGCAEDVTRQNGVQIRLDDDMLAEKIAAARSYSELRDEVDNALALKGAEYFRNEWLFPSDGTAKGEAYKPQYEEFGERRVAQGKYLSVLRYREHMLPIFSALRRHSDSRTLALQE